jgi:hypothetical protein
MGGMSYEEGKTRLKRMKEYQEKGAVRDQGRAKNLTKSYVNSVALREGHQAARELMREINSR